MKKIIIGSIVVALTFAAVIVTGDNDQIPKGWFAAGSNPAEYEMGIDNSNFEAGHSSAYIKSKSPGENEFGTLMQTISAENYLDKRLRLTGYIKSEAVEGWSGMWMRIDGDNKKNLEFDNMQNRPIKGTNDWMKCEIVLDVPA